MVNDYSNIEWNIINLLKYVDVLEKYNSKDRNVFVDVNINLKLYLVWITFKFTNSAEEGVKEMFT
jgi:hypothetical protein